MNTLNKVNSSVGDGDSLLADTAAALYCSKHRGRNCSTHITDPVEVGKLNAAIQRITSNIRACRSARVSFGAR